MLTGFDSDSPRFVSVAWSSYAVTFYMLLRLLSVVVPFFFVFLVRGAADRRLVSV
jgi:hypothetical protein